MPTQLSSKDNTTQPPIQIVDITIPTMFNYNLAGTLFTPTTDPNIKKGTIKHAIMLAPATGIKRQFYKAFASFLAENGFAVVTFDNQGIGDTLKINHDTVKKSTASLISWGRQDMPAVLNYLIKKFPKTENPDIHYHLIGHSAGGQLIGLMPNYAELSSVFNVACSSGRIKNMAMPYRAKAMFFMDVFIPTNNLIFGYTQADKIGMGEPLLRNVAKQWRDWCNGQGYIKTAFGKTVQQHFYNDIRTPSLWLNAVDDDIANEKNVADMLSVFPNLPAEKRTLNPADYGLKEIGHMKFFSRQSQVLWTQAVEWITSENKVKNVNQ